MKAPLTLTLIAAALFTSFLQAEPVLKFGEADWHPILRNDTATLSQTSVSTQIEAPNFWSMVLQDDKVNFDLSQAKPEQHLAIKIRGSVEDEQPTLRLILFTDKWQSSSVWVFDLTDLDPDNFKVIPAMTPISEPASNDNGKAQADLNSPILIIQLISKSGKGNKPWSFEIESLEVVDAPPAQ